MRTQEIKDSINKTREFMELWIKFHQIFKESMGKSPITPEEEDLFLQTKSIIACKFQTLADSLSIDRPTIDRTYEVINQILSLKSISTLSEQTLAKIENDWHESYISLNRLLGHLEAQRDIAVRERHPFIKAWKSSLKYFIYLLFIILLALIILYFMYVLGVLKISE